MTTVRVGNHGIKLTMWDTPGQGEYDRFRPLAYSSADIFLICFSIDDPMSLEMQFINGLSRLIIINQTLLNYLLVINLIFDANYPID